MAKESFWATNTMPSSMPSGRLK